MRTWVGRADGFIDPPRSASDLRVCDVARQFRPIFGLVEQARALVADLGVDTSGSSYLSGHMGERLQLPWRSGDRYGRCRSMLRAGLLALRVQPHTGGCYECRCYARSSGNGRGPSPSMGAYTRSFQRGVLVN